MKISQREARRMRKQLAVLEEMEGERRRRWASDYPGGTHIRTMAAHPEDFVAVTTARKLGHACIVMPGETNMLKVVALPLAK